MIGRRRFMTTGSLAVAATGIQNTSEEVDKTLAAIRTFA